jgi:DNA-binding beta-propeller fold protein YncE
VKETFMFTRSAGRRTGYLLVGAITAAATVAACSSSSGAGAPPSSAHVASSSATSPSPVPAGVTVPPAIRVQRTLSAPATWIRYGLGSVWAVTNGGAVLRLSSSGKTLAEPVRGGAVDVKFEGQHMYVLKGSDVEELDPATGHVEHRRAIANGISFDVRGGVAYVAAEGTGNASVVSVDLATGRRHSYALPFQLATEEHNDAIGADASGDLWAIDGDVLLLFRASALTLVRRYQLPFNATTLLTTPTGVFVATQNSGGGIVRLTPGAKSVRTCWGMGDALQIAADGANVWVSASSGLTELSARTCAVLGQVAPLDGGATSVAVLPGEVWVTYPDFNKIQVVAR